MKHETPGTITETPRGPYRYDGFGWWVSTWPDQGNRAVWIPYEHALDEVGAPTPLLATPCPAFPTLCKVGSVKCAYCGHYIRADLLHNRVFCSHRANIKKIILESE